MTQQDDITQRLRDNADLDEAEHGNARVVQLEREAADEIERLRAELSKLRAPVAEQKPIKLSDDVLHFLKEGVENATQCEESDVDQEFADQLLLLMHTPLYTEPLPKQREVDWGPLVAAPVADERAAFKRCNSAIIKAISSIARADGPDTRKEDDPELLYRSPVMDEVVRIRVALDECSAALASAPVADERLSDATLAALVNKHGLHALPIMQVFEFAKDVCAALASAPVAVPVSPDLQAQIVALRRPDWPSTGNRSSFHEGYETARVDILRLLRRSAPVAGEAQERIEQMAVNRYRPVPDGKFSYKVVAGDGSRSLYTGTKDSCLRVAAKLTEAFLDGAFVASDAAPQASKDGEHGE